MCVTFIRESLIMGETFFSRGSEERATKGIMRYRSQKIRCERGRESLSPWILGPWGGSTLGGGNWCTLPWPLGGTLGCQKVYPRRLPHGLPCWAPLWGPPMPRAPPTCAPKCPFGHNLALKVWPNLMGLGWPKRPDLDGLGHSATSFDTPDLLRHFMLKFKTLTLRCKIS
jgi:hypothetical protein